MLNKDKIIRINNVNAPVIKQDQATNTQPPIKEAEPIVKEEPTININTTSITAKPVASANKDNLPIIDVGSGFNLEIGDDCMICGQPFTLDWQHKNYNVCPKCREKIKNLIYQ